MKDLKLEDLISWSDYEETHFPQKTPDGHWYLVPLDARLDDTRNKKFDCLMITDKTIIQRRPYQVTKVELGLR